MRIVFLLFAVSLGSLVLWPTLPSFSTVVGLFLTSAFLLFLCFRNSPHRFATRLLLALVLGVLVASLRGHLSMARLLPSACSHQYFQFTASVVGLPQYSKVRAENLARFTVEIQALEQSSLSFCPSLSKIIGSKIQLSWYAAPVEFTPGEEWRFDAKLIRPRGQSNPHGSDYQLSLMVNGIVAHGSVRTGVNIGQASEGLSGLRFRWRNYLLARTESEEVSKILVALTIGESRSLAQSIKTLFQHTGTSHLMAISGLHIGIMALCGYWVGRLLGALLLLLSIHCRTYNVNARVVASLTSLIFAAVYAALSGFALPTQRALIMVALFLLSKIVAKHWSLFDVWLYALVFVLLLDPLQAADGGFYLSFTAVLVLVLAMSSRRIIQVGFFAGLQRWLRPQLVIFIGLLPLSIYLFGGLSLASVLANSVAIPWVTVSSVPLSLAGFLFWCIDPLWSDWILVAASLSVRWLLSVLTFFDGHFFDLGWLTVTLSRSLLIVFSAFALALLLPAPLKLKVSVVVLACVMGLMDLQLKSVFYSSERRVTIFDVGQGLAVLIEADGQRLLYDTGPPLGEYTDAFSQIIWPYLRSQGSSELDGLVVSHNDADHAGGVARLSEQMALANVYAGEPQKLAQRLITPAASIKNCNQGKNIHVLGSSGRFYFRTSGASSEGNDASCVMLVEFPELHMLLPGDISNKREAALSFPSAGEAGAFKVLVVPHHGSRSSSSYGLMQQFQPDLAVVSAGFRSRYGHPHEEVLERLKNLDIDTINTADMGAIQLRWYPNQAVRIYRWRETEKHFWFDG